MVRKVKAIANFSARCVIFLIGFILVTLIFPMVLASHLGVCVWEGVALSVRTMMMGYSRLFEQLTDGNDSN